MGDAKESEKTIRVSKTVPISARAPRVYNGAFSLQRPTSIEELTPRPLDAGGARSKISTR